MKKLILCLLLLPGLLLGAPNDLILSQAKSPGPGNTERLVTPVANSAMGFDASLVPVVLTAFTQNSATGAVAITAGGTAQNITLTPSTTGQVITPADVVIGEGSSTSYKLYIRHTADLTKTRGINVEMVPTLVANNATAFRGEAVSLTVNTSASGFNATGVSRGASYLANGAGTGGTITELAGFHGAIQQTGSAVITTAKGASSNIGITGTANITTGYNFYGDSATAGTGGLVPTYYGSFIANPVAGFGGTLAAAFSAPWDTASNRYGLYFPGTVQHFLGGPVAFTGATVRTATAIAGNALDLSKQNNTQSLTGDVTWTFSGGHVAGRYAGFTVSADATPRVVTLPANVNPLGSSSALASFTVPASSTVIGGIYDDGTNYFIVGNPAIPLPIASGGTNAITASAAFDNLSGAETSVASAGTTDLGAVASNKVSITGTTTITSFGTATSGVTRSGRFTGALTLTHNGTSLILPGAANITTAAGDRFEAVSLGSGNWAVYYYTKASGGPVVGTSSSIYFLSYTPGTALAAITNTLTFWGGTTIGPRQQQFKDTTGCRQARIKVTVAATASNATTTFVARYFTAQSATWSDFVANSSEISVTLSTAQNTVFTGNWVTLDAAAIGDKMWVLGASDSANAGLNPTYTQVSLEFR